MRFRPVPCWLLPGGLLSVSLLLVAVAIGCLGLPVALTLLVLGAVRLRRR
jgi:hypothetical protein